MLNFNLQSTPDKNPNKNIDTITANGSEKPKGAIANKFERDFLLTKRKWVDSAVFWKNNLINDSRLNKSANVLDKTQSRIDGIDGDIEAAKEGMESELEFLQRRRETLIEMERSTTDIDQDIKDSRINNQEKIAQLESKRKGLLEIREKQENIKNSFAKTKTDISNEMNDKIDQDISLVERQFNLQALEQRQAILFAEVERINLDIDKIKEERNRISADAVELDYDGPALAKLLIGVDKRLARIQKDRDKVFAEFSKTRKRIKVVNRKKLGWEDFRNSLNISPQKEPEAPIEEEVEIPEILNVEDEPVKILSAKEQKDQFKNSDVLRDFIAKQAPDAYIVDPSDVSKLYNNIHDNDDLNLLPPKDVRREVEKNIIGKRKAENEKKLIAMKEDEKVDSLKGETEKLWEYLFQTIYGSDNKKAVENFVSGPNKGDGLDIILNKRLKTILSDVGYAFTPNQYEMIKDRLGEVFVAKAKKMFIESIEKINKEGQDKFLRSPEHKDYVNGLVDGLIKTDNYIVFDDVRVKDALDKNGFTNLTPDDIKDYLANRSIELINKMDRDEQLGILRKDIALKVLLYESGLIRVKYADEFDFATFHTFLSRKGFDKISNSDPEFRTIIIDYINRQPEEKAKAEGEAKPEDKTKSEEKTKKGDKTKKRKV